MANEHSISNPTSLYAQLLFANHAGDFGAAPATASNTRILGTPTDVEMDFDNIAASGGGIQSAKFDFGETRAGLYSLDGILEFEANAGDAEFVDFWIGFSHNGTAGTGNPGGLTGAAGSYTETDGSLLQLKRIGSLSTVVDTLAEGHVGFVLPEARYGMLVSINNSSAAGRSTATAMDETHFVLTPVTDEPAA